MLMSKNVNKDVSKDSPILCAAVDRNRISEDTRRSRGSMQVTNTHEMILLFAQ